MPVELRLCPCGSRYEVLQEGEFELALTCEDPLHLACPACGATEYSVLIGEAAGVHLGGAVGVGRVYPYFDRGLGAWVESAQHRDHLLRFEPATHPDGRPNEDAGKPRAVPLVIADGYDTEAELDDRRWYREQVAAKRRDLADQDAADPNRGERKRAEDILQRMIDANDLSLWGL